MIELYYPGREFVVASVTGKRCDLMCRHCNARYLRHMQPTESPEDLYSLALNAEKEGSMGMLISGGSDRNGKVPLFDYLDKIKNIKKNTNLKVNLHTGFIDEEDVEAMKRTGADVISFDVVGSANAVRNVYGLELAPDYFDTILSALTGAGMNVVPHVTAGLDGGSDSGEDAALEVIAGHAVKMVIVNSLIPAPGQNLDGHRLVPVLEAAAKTLPGSARIGIGCMRPRDIELPVERLGELRVSAVASPTPALRNQLLHAGIELMEMPGCCAFASVA
ncbi:MAG: hypothetical protein AYK23_02585 [Candidatus Proteinoplasmatales archaeon SG8-5]|nr:MAG: hypothetical protein AYK23_02585 [Candidatus Proteinoplasmatales archaeon SG8-5]